MNLREVDGWLAQELFQYILYIGLSPKDLNPHPFLRIDGCWSSLSAAEFRGAVVANKARCILDGVFDAVPTRIAQTTDGFLWIGTESGLIRFDGVHFQPWATKGRRGKRTARQSCTR
jgi:hypothetical protein